MRTDNLALVGRLAALVGALAVLLTLFFWGVRPWYQRWGATESEARSTLPGDELLVGGRGSTRAITIDAPTTTVWRWLAQLGQDRGGFYSYEFLEDLVGAEMENRSELDPRIPPWKRGDKLWMYPPNKLNGAGHADLLRIDPGQALVFGTWQFGTDMSKPSNGTWAFVLEPLPADQTRLIVRSRAAGERPPLAAAFDVLVFEPIHFVMERKMLEGIKAHAEGRGPAPVADFLEITMFVATFALFVSAAWRLMRWGSVRSLLMVLIATGLGFQLLTFVQPPWVLGLFVIMGLVSLSERLDAPNHGPDARAAGGHQRPSVR